MTRFRLKSSVEPLSTADGALYLVRAGADDLTIRDPEPADRALLERLAVGERSATELAAELDLDGAAVQSKLDALRGAGVITAVGTSPPLAPDDAERFSRQLPYLADLGDAPELQRALGSAQVVVIGCGGLGTWTLAALAGAGVRRLRLVDDDVVELSNLNRQVLFSPADVGRPKVDAATAWLRAFDDQIAAEPHRRRIDGPDAAAAAVEGAAVVVLLADWPPYELARWVNAACVPRGIPFITGGQLPPLVKVGPLYVPGHSACFACHERALSADSPGYDGYVQRLRDAPSRGATLGPASGIVGTLLAMEVMHLLVGREPASTGAALLLDLATATMRREPIARDPGCPACG